MGFTYDKQPQFGVERVDPESKVAVAQRKPTAAAHSNFSGPEKPFDGLLDLYGSGQGGESAELAPVVQLKANRSVDPALIQGAAKQGTQGSPSPFPHFDAIQQSFGGYDLSQVSAFSNAPAKKTAETLGAEAYTMGNNVVFNGQPSLHTAAHEAAHVIQQRTGNAPRGVGQSGDNHEAHADAVADRVVRGESAEPMLSSLGPARGAADGASVQFKDSNDQKKGTDDQLQKLAAGAPDLSKLAPGGGDTIKKLTEPGAPDLTKLTGGATDALKELTGGKAPDLSALAAGGGAGALQKLTGGGAPQANVGAGPTTDDRPKSDYERFINGETPTMQQNAGPNDDKMAQKKNPVSDTLNKGVGWGMGKLGFSTQRRTGADDNDFYRDNAQYMPGWNLNGMPSGAWAQDRATNTVGQGKGKGSSWDNIRRGLVKRESAMISENKKEGGSGKLSFWQVYDAHVKAYAGSGGKGNQFVDPGSFALAVYVAPLIEKLGIDSGPITGASIDLLNNPEDTAAVGWAKRMGLGMGQVGAGFGLMKAGHPLLGGATMALGAGGMAWNTLTALGGSKVAKGMSNAVSGALKFGGNVISGGKKLLGGAGDAIKTGGQKLLSGGKSLLGKAGGALKSLFGWGKKKDDE